MTEAHSFVSRGPPGQQAAPTPALTEGAGPPGLSGRWRQSHPLPGSCQHAPAFRQRLDGSLPCPPLKQRQSQRPKQTAGRSAALLMFQRFSLPLVSMLQSHSTGPFRSTRLSSWWPGASSLKCAPLPTRAHRTLIWGVFAKWTFLFCSLRLTCCSIKWHCASDNQVCASFRDDCPICQTH